MPKKKKQRIEQTVSLLTVDHMLKCPYDQATYESVYATKQRRTARFGSIITIIIINMYNFDAWCRLYAVECAISFFFVDRNFSLYSFRILS